MENAIIYQVLGVLLVLFFCFLTFMNTRTWRAAHVTFMLFVFFATIVFCIYASMTLKTRRTWLQEYTRLEKELQETVVKVEEVNDGKLEEVPQTTPSVRTIREELGRAVIDRGRVWRECTVTNIDPAGTISLSTIPPGTPEGTPVPPNRIEEKTVLFAFNEQTSADGWKVPNMYLGTYSAAAVTDTSVTLAPLLPLDAGQLAAINERGPTWTLYEMAPIDALAPFEGLDQAQLRELIKRDPNVPDAAYDAILSSYARSGQRAGNDDPPDSVWLKVRFKKNYKIDVDSPMVAATLLDGAYYDPNGRAQVERLKRGDAAEFGVADTGIFLNQDIPDQEDVKDLIDQGIAELIEPIYVRKLHDYDFEFRALFARMAALSERLRDVGRDIESLTNAEREAQKQIAYRQDEKQKLEGDLKIVKYEQAVVARYEGMLNGRIVEVRNAVNQYYRANKAMAQELANVSAQLADEINRRTAAAP